MTILLLGGTGKTATRAAALLKDANIDFLMASRRGPDAAPKGYPAIKFDWTDESSWTAPFEQQSVDAVYMMEPQVDQPWLPMIKFIDLARNKGVKRFVLCGGTTTARGQDGMGRVWDHFIDSGVEYCVLRPSWFMENLIEPGLVYTIGTLNKIFTACGDGKIPFISADDIAAVAFHALTDKTSHNCDYRVLGPELLTYDDVAFKLSKILGRPIEHVKLDREARVQNLVQAGVSDYYAKFFTNVEVKASENIEASLGDAVEKVTGRSPKSIDTFAKDNAALWK